MSVHDDMFELCMNSGNVMRMVRKCNNSTVVDQQRFKVLKKER